MTSHQHLDHRGAQGPPDEGAEVVAAGDLLVEGPDGRVQAVEEELPLRLHLLAHSAVDGGEEALLALGAEVLEDGDDVLHGPLGVGPAEPPAQAGESVGRHVLGGGPGGGTGAGAEHVLAERHELERDVSSHQPRAVARESQQRLGGWRSVTVLYFTVLYCTVLYCTLLNSTVLYCTVLYCTVLYCTVQDMYW